MKKKVLNTIPKPLFERYCGRARTYLESEGVEVITYQGDTVMTAEEIKAVGQDIGAVMLGCDAWPEDVLKACPNLKVIARFGIGLELVDLDAAKRLGIKVVNARGMNSDSVAEMTIAQVLAVYRNLVVLDRTTREGQWMRYAGHTIRGKVYGLVGFGAIAQNVAQLLGGFGVKRIIACDKMPDRDAAARLNVDIVDFDEVISQADIISLHVPATSQTHHLIDEAALNRMKREAILINMARGAVIDEQALYRALKDRRIAGAGLDVFEQEPTSADNPLFGLDNVVLTPHQAADTMETFDAVSYFDAQVIVDVFAGKEPVNWVNK